LSAYFFFVDVDVFGVDHVLFTAAWPEEEAPAAEPGSVGSPLSGSKPFAESAFGIL